MEKYVPTKVDLVKAVKSLKKLTQIPISAYAQGDGRPEDYQGWEFTRQANIDIYLKEAKHWIQDGAQIIGGCCGTTPKYIEVIKSILSNTLL